MKGLAFMTNTAAQHQGHREVMPMIRTREKNKYDNFKLAVSQLPLKK